MTSKIVQYTVVAFPFVTCLANNYFQIFFFFALTSSQLFSLSPGRFRTGCKKLVFFFAAARNNFGGKLSFVLSLIIPS
jgi:hypothetical protein